MSKIRKFITEHFVAFLETPTREGLRDVLRDNIGELAIYDAKKGWIELPKLARHLLGMANSGGGYIVFGVAQADDGSLEAVGLEKIEDKAKVKHGLEPYLPKAAADNVDILDFQYKDAAYGPLAGKLFQVAFIEDDPAHLPFVSCAQADGIKANMIYVRRGTSSEPANHEEIQRIINRRLETGHSTQREIDLNTHIDQLKVLYAQIDQYHVRIRAGSIAKVITAFGSSMAEVFGESISIPNPAYPEEDFEAFIVRMIGKKKSRIARELDLLPD